MLCNWHVSDCHCTFVLLYIVITFSPHCMSYFICNHQPLYAQVVISCVLSSCARPLNKSSPPTGSVPHRPPYICRNRWLGLGCEWALWGFPDPGTLFPNPVSSSCVTQREDEKIFIFGRGLLVFFPSSFSYLWHWKHYILWSYLTVLHVLARVRTKVTYASNITWFGLRILFLKWKNWIKWFPSWFFLSSTK